MGKIINDQYVEQKFQEVANEMMSGKQKPDLSFILEGYCGEDLSKFDMSNLSLKNFKRLTFDSKTKFSPEQIEKFHPEEIIEQGKKFSRDTEKLHKEGIDGSGTSIALLDRPFDSSGEEFDDRVAKQIVIDRVEDDVVYREYRDDDDDGFHGKTTASLAAGKQCGVAPKANMYLFGVGQNISWVEAKDAMLKYIRDNNIKLDIISISADIETTKEGQEILSKLDKDGCAIIESSKYWKDFSWGRNNDDGVEIDEMMKAMSNAEYDENSRGGKVIKNIPNTAILPCTGRTSLQVEEKGYKYNGTLCGASFAISQVAGLFCMARQINSSIKYDEFIDIVKNPERVNSDGMMYVDVGEIMKDVAQKSKISTQEFNKQQAKQPSVAEQKKEVQPKTKSIKDEVGDELQPKTQEEKQNG